MGVCASKPTPSKLVKRVSNDLAAIDPTVLLSNRESLIKIKDMSEMRLILYGDSQTIQPNPQKVEQLCTELFAQDIITKIIETLPSLEFETCKDAVHVVNYLIKEKNSQSVAVLKKDPRLMNTLADSCSNVHIAIHCNSILRNCICDDDLLATFFTNSYDKFVEHVQISTFDVASNNFTTLKTALLRDPVITGNFFNSNEDKIISSFNALFRSKNQVTKRTSVKLIGELLEEKNNSSTRAAFVKNEESCKLVCELLTGKAKALGLNMLAIFASVVPDMAIVPPNNKIINDHKQKNCRRHYSV